MCDIKYRYFCNTEQKNIYERRTKNYSHIKPSNCINNIDHSIDEDSVSICYTFNIFPSDSSLFNEQIQNNSQKIEQIETLLSNSETFKNNFIAIENPSTINDELEGYFVGSRWLNTITNELFTCISNTLQNAIWKKNEIRYILETETVNENSKIVKTFNFLQNGTYAIYLQCLVSTESISCYLEQKCLIKKEENANTINLDFLSIENDNTLNIFLNIKEKNDAEIDMEIIGEKNRKIKWKIEYDLIYLNN